MKLQLPLHWSLGVLNHRLVASKDRHSTPVPQHLISRSGFVCVGRMSKLYQLLFFFFELPLVMGKLLRYDKKIGAVLRMVLLLIEWKTDKKITSYHNVFCTIFLRKNFIPLKIYIVLWALVR